MAAAAVRHKQAGGTEKNEGKLLTGAPRMGNSGGDADAVQQRFSEQREDRRQREQTHLVPL